MMQVQSAILIGILSTALTLSTLPTITQAQPQKQQQQPSSISAAQNFNYTPEECTQWVSTAISIQSSTAGMGLSQSEFMLFLGSLPLLEPYFDLFSSVSSGGNTAAEDSALLVTFGSLPFEVQLAYPTLACWCEELGDGEGCCEGENNPKINVSVLLLEEDDDEVALAYRQDFCAFVDLVVKELLKVSDAANAATSTTTVGPTTSSAISTTATTTSTSTSTTTSSNGNVDTTTTGTQSSSLPSVTTVTTPTATSSTTSSSQSSSSSDTNPITFNIIGSVIDYSNDAPTPSTAEAATTTAKDILANSESTKGVMSQFIQGFTKLSIDMLKTKCLLLPVSILGELDVTLVEDVACPKGLTYAPPNASCIEFTITMTPTEDLSQYDQLRSCLEDTINTAINDDGLLYNIIATDIISKSDDTTKITGLGNPGDGLTYNIDKNPFPNFNPNPADETDDEAISGLGGGYIFLIILALFSMPFIVFAFKRNRERQTEEMARVREFAGEPANNNNDDMQYQQQGNNDLENPAVVVIPIVGAVRKEKKEEEKEEKVEEETEHGAEDDESSAPSVWSESRGSQVDIVDEENTANPTNAMMGSSLAAMGVASAVATNLYEKKNTVEGKKEGGTSQQQVFVVAGGGKQEEEEETQDMESIRAEVKSLVAKTSPGKTADELLSAYVGKEEELLSHLRRLARETS
mmetsp:Transcript_17287/g.27096  ORF Transcript_17287/g.27096 Transcript_17287/m.27096 type:complete len:691 (+) Transcript_17287:121-2193(+)